jgi:DnaD/phage-associated family protein
MTEDQVIIDASDLRKYRTELPNLYDDSDLTVYEFRLLAHYKRVGKCTEGLPATCKKCHMSAGQASEARQSLADKKFIRLEKVPMGGARFCYNVTVNDRWIENFARYSGLTEKEIEDQLKSSRASPHEGSPSQSPTCGEGKKELKELDLIVINAGANFKIYEQEIGGLTPMIAEAIKDAENTYPPDWIPEAIAIAVRRNIRNWKYVEVILANCKAKNIRPSLNKLEAENGNAGKYSSGTTKAGASRRKIGQADGRGSNGVVEETDAGKLAEINRRRRDKSRREPIAEVQ